MPEVKDAPRPKTERMQEPAREMATLAERDVRRAARLARRASSLALRAGSPFGFIRRFAEEMDRLFDDFGVEFSMLRPGPIARGHERRPEAGRPETEWSPRIDVKEDDGRLLVRADLPGLARDDIQVEMTEDTLTIQGERKQEKKEEREGYSYTECSYGRFYRAIPLPEGIDTTKVTAEFQNGVLEIGIPLPPHPEPEARRIEVREKK